MSLDLHILEDGGRFDQISGFFDDTAAGTRTGFGATPRFASVAPVITADLQSKARVELQLAPEYVETMDDRDRLGLALVLVEAASLGRPFTALLSDAWGAGTAFVALVSYVPALDARGPACRICGCVEQDCRLCVERTGQACYWAVVPDWDGLGGLCSACAEVQP